jgi:type 1 fimbriae regulatory protein FimE
VLALEVLNRPQAPARSPDIALCLHLGTSRAALRSRIPAHGGQGGRGREIHLSRSFPHAARHARGFKLANDGHDTRAIRAYLGHRSIMSTVRYTALTPNRFKHFWKD